MHPGGLLLLGARARGTGLVAHLVTRRCAPEPASRRHVRLTRTPATRADARLRIAKTPRRSRTLTYESDNAGSQVAVK